ncbi:MAG: 23S rRNA (uracil(1939)-C(5))-methyltransferase RlmD [Clostridia bacterium]|nr:23S rRNA (uracil(1939)-C(5))-methyltransferase RlmD [Clostridia bacterium]
MQNTLKKNDELEVTIERLGINGEGIATYEGRVIFVPYALVGERVKIHIINDKNSFLIAKLLEVIIPSEDRCEAVCPYFYKCGGCDIQHLKYEKQLLLKKDIVKDTIYKYAKLDVNVNDTIASDNVFRYRNKFAFPVSSVGGEIKIGMYRKNSHNIIEIDDCLLQSEKTKTILEIFKSYMIENKISAYDEKTKKGIVKHIVVRENKDEFILTVVVTNEKFNNFNPLIEKLKTKFDKFGIVKNVNKLGNNVIFGNTDTYIYGLKELNMTELGIKYSVNNRSFLQVNDDIKTKIYNKILELTNGSKKIIDAYSGAGLLSSIMAKNGSDVIGVEIIEEATKNAENLKKINKLNNLTNLNGDCARIIPELIKGEKEDFIVVIDPPRKGIDKSVIDALNLAKPKVIVYLSCNPATLARDLGYLSENYDVDFVQPYDMFPQTANVETLVKLSLKKV